MKKVIFTILIGLLCLSLCSCSKSKPTTQKAEKSKIITEAEKNNSITENKTEQAAEKEPEKEPPKSITLGETVKTDSFEFTLNRVELSYSVEPDNPPSYYNYYDTNDGQIYIYVNATIKNLTQQDIRCDSVYGVLANYNNGYTYRGFNIVTEDDGDFGYANINYITPLETMGIHCLIECPKEIETPENPLNLTIKLKDGNEFLYTVR